MRHSKEQGLGSSNYCKEHQGDGSHYAQHNCELCSLEKHNKLEDVWLKAWLATVSSDTCIEATVPTTYADQCLEDFKKRFR